VPNSKKQINKNKPSFFVEKPPLQNQGKTKRSKIKTKHIKQSRRTSPRSASM
jgi:hypothetical protein